MLAHATNSPGAGGWHEWATDYATVRTYPGWDFHLHAGLERLRLL